MAYFSVLVDVQVTCEKSMTRNAESEKSPGLRDLNAQIPLPTLQLFHHVTVGTLLDLSDFPWIKQDLDKIMSTIPYNFYIL